VKRHFYLVATALIVASWLLSPFVLQALAANNETVNLSGATSLGYKPDRQTLVFRNDVAVVDTAATTMSTTNLDLTPQFGVNGRKNVSVSARFSVAAATVSVVYVACWEDSTGTIVPLGYLGPVTLTAPASGFRLDTLYTPQSYVFDSLGGNTGYLIVSTAPSSGTVDFWVGSY
jgi:hypothetical protein